MKTIWRNLNHLFRRFKMATWLNIAGLTVAFASFLVILIQVRFEFTYDKFHSNSGRIFRIDLPDSLYGTFSYILPRALADAVIQSSPHIEAGTILTPFLGEIYFSVQEGEGKKGFKELFYTANPSITRIFDFQIQVGDPDCLNDPEKVIIPESLSRKIFGSVSPLGKQLHAEQYIWTKDNHSVFTVGAVYKDFPENSQLNNGIFTAIDPDFSKDNWGSSNFLCYVLLDHKSSARAVEETYNQNKALYEKNSGRSSSLKLVPFESLYFMQVNGADSRIVKTGNRESSLVLLGIGLLVLIVAAINFTNFSSSLAPMRIKNINTHKVLGGDSGFIRFSLVMEAISLSFLAWAFSLLLVSVLNKTAMLSFIDAEINPENNIPLILLTGFISLFLGFIAGIYPAWYMTSFPPALVLKGSFGLSPKGRQMRTLLIGFQFIVSMILIISALFVHLQRNFMQDYHLGFDKDQILLVDLTPDFYLKNKNTYTSRLKDYPGIEDVAFSTEKVGSQDTYSTSGFRFRGEHIQVNDIGISYNFFSVMGIPVVEGRMPLPGDEQDGTRNVFFSKNVRDEFGVELGLQDMLFYQGNVLGFTEHVKFNSLRNEDANLRFEINRNSSKPVSYVRISAGTNFVDVVDYIRKTVDEIEPGFPLEFQFYDEVFNQLYHKEENLNRMVTVFSFLAIIISIMGVFGLVLFETQYRRKEIGVRKVMGAEIKDILIMFNKVYIDIIVFCFIIAAPVAYFVVSKWLENFAFKTPLYWWVFVLAFILVTAVTMITVTFQNWNAASENPVNSIKTE